MDEGGRKEGEEGKGRREYQEELYLKGFRLRRIPKERRTMKRRKGEKVYQWRKYYWFSVRRGRRRG